MAYHIKDDDGDEEEERRTRNQNKAEELVSHVQYCLQTLSLLGYIYSYVSISIDSIYLDILIYLFLITYLF